MIETRDKIRDKFAKDFLAALPNTESLNYQFAMALGEAVADVVIETHRKFDEFVQAALAQRHTHFHCPAGSTLHADGDTVIIQPVNAIQP